MQHWIRAGKYVACAFLLTAAGCGGDATGSRENHAGAGGVTPTNDQGGTAPDAPGGKGGTAACLVGSLRCDCRDNGSCDAGLSCESGTCVECPAGRVGCPCYGNDTCDSGAICTDDACVLEDVRETGGQGGVSGAPSGPSPWATGGAGAAAGATSTDGPAGHAGVGGSSPSNGTGGVLSVGGSAAPTGGSIGVAGSPGAPGSGGSGSSGGQCAGTPTDCVTPPEPERVCTTRSGATLYPTIGACNQLAVDECELYPGCGRMTCEPLQPQVSEYVPPRAPGVVCTEELVDTHWSECVLGGNCAAFEGGGAYEECGACLAVSELSDTQYGPYLRIGDRYVPNVGGCLDISNDLPLGSTCARSRQLMDLCLLTSCVDCTSVGDRDLCFQDRSTSCEEEVASEVVSLSPPCSSPTMVWSRTMINCVEATEITEYGKEFCARDQSPPPLECPEGQEECSGICVDLATDPNNCGECGTACSMGQSCVAGSCNCAAGRIDCGGVCVDPMSDANNCGSCENSCLPPDVCVGGSCE